MKSLTEKVAFLERYVTFRRKYSELEFKIDFRDDTSMPIGLTAYGCDVRLWATVPIVEVDDWHKGLERRPHVSSSELGWTRDIPHTLNRLDAFDWFSEQTTGSGEKVVGVLKNDQTAEVIYRVVCPQN